MKRVNTQRQRYHNLILIIVCQFSDRVGGLLETMVVNTETVTSEAEMLALPKAKVELAKPIEGEGEEAIDIHTHWQQLCH